MREEETYELLKKYGQEHIVRHIELLSEHEKDIFIQNLSTMNLELVFRLYENFARTDEKETKKYREIKPHPIIDIKQYRERSEVALMEVDDYTYNQFVSRLENMK